MKFEIMRLDCIIYENNHKFNSFKGTWFAGLHLDFQETPFSGTQVLCNSLNGNFVYFFI